MIHFKFRLAPQRASYFIGLGIMSLVQLKLQCQHCLLPRLGVLEWWPN